MVSKMFKTAFIDAGTCVAQCGFCGRIHYDVTGEGMEPGELRSLEAERAKNVSHYHVHDGPVYWGYVDGKQWIPDCDCSSRGTVEDYERFAWAHRTQLWEYFRLRVESRLALAQREKQEVDAANPR
ncbi:MAG: hypothetical protein ACYTDW_09335 [Planctomycetota bacterium]|jgi:hypothetical protein